MSPPAGSEDLIRKAGSSDAPVLARLRYAFRAGLHPPIEGEEAFLERCRRWMVDRLTPGGVWHCWLAEERAVPIGSAWLQLLDKIPNPVGEPEVHGYVTSLYVHSEFRGRGIGSALLARCLGECQARGADSVFLWPTPRSRPLYDRHGFSVREDLLERRIDRPPVEVKR